MDEVTILRTLLGAIGGGALYLAGKHFWKGVRAGYRVARYRRIYTFRSTQGLAAEGIAVADNAWHGTLTTNAHMTAEYLGELRALVKIYQLSNRWPPPDGTQFIVENRTLRKL
jgi:hypothetical protein